MQRLNLVRELYRIGAVKLGSFTLKSGAVSPIYIDMRQIISYPKILQAVADLQWEKIAAIQTDFICGVPYTTLPIATAIALQHDRPMLMVRKEAKNYGTKQLVEGAYRSGQSCLVIEDVVTTGSSIVEVMQKLAEVNVKVPAVVAFLDRGQGGEQALAKAGCQFYSVLSLPELLNNLKQIPELRAEDAIVLDGLVR